MNRFFTLSGALAFAIASPATAQTTDTSTLPPAPDSAITIEAQTPAEIAVQAEPAVEAPPASDRKVAAVTQIIETEFPNYDVDKSGDLSQPEFTAWVLALHNKAEDEQAASKLDATSKAKWAKDAFATADVDKSKKVTKMEMSSFLMS